MMTHVKVSAPQKMVMDKRLTIINEKSMQFTRTVPAHLSADPEIQVNYFRVEIGVQITRARSERSESEDTATPPTPFKFYRLSNEQESVSLADDIELS